MGGVEVLSLGTAAEWRGDFGDDFEVRVAAVDEIAVTGVVWAFDRGNLTGEVHVVRSGLTGCYEEVFGVELREYMNRASLCQKGMWIEEYKREEDAAHTWYNHFEYMYSIEQSWY